MDFPVHGDWTVMMNVQKEASVATKEDFVGVYDAFYNSLFMKALSEASDKDLVVTLENDTLWYLMSLARSYGEYEGSLVLEYYVQNDRFKLKRIYGIGASFYDMVE